MKFNGHNLRISNKSRIGENVRIGDDTVIYDNVEIGDNAVICNNCVIGEPLNQYYRDPEYVNPRTVIGPGATVRSHALIYASCTIGAGFNSGHHVLLRENTVIGDNCSIGSYTDIEGEVRMGNYCRLHSNVHISQASSLGDYVWMFPFSVVTNDPYPPSYDLRGAFIGDYTLICVQAVVLSGAKIGAACLVGANSVVNRNLPDYSMAVGNPVAISDVRKYVVLGKGRPYPWMPRFDRGMPWEGLGWEKWVSERAKDVTAAE